VESWDGFSIRLNRIARLVSTPLFVLVRALGVSPNQVTLSRLWLCGPFIVLGYGAGSYWLGMAGFAFVLVSSLLDFVDGRLAHATGQVTRHGGWLDSRVDVILQSLVVAGAAAGVVRNPDTSVFWMIGGVAALFSQAVLVHFTDMYGGVFQQGLAFLEAVDKLPSMTAGERMVNRFLMVHGPMMFIGTHRYALAICTVLGRLEIYLLVTAVYQNVRWVVLWYLMTRVLARPDTPYYALVKEYVEQGYDYRSQT